MDFISLPDQENLILGTSGTEKHRIGFWDSKAPERVEGSRYTFEDLHRLLLQNNRLDFLIVSGHSTAKGGEEQGVPNEAKHIMGGNFSDLQYIPDLISHFAFTLSRNQDTNGSVSSKVAILPDIYLSADEAKAHNLILLGTGNVNWVTEHVFRHFWENAHVLPIHFKSMSTDDVIVSELSAKEYSLPPLSHGEEDYGILEMVPNPWNPEKVAVLCCGIDLWGTQAATLALCRADLNNNKHNHLYPAKVLSVRLEKANTVGFSGHTLNLRKIAGDGITFLE